MRIRQNKSTREKAPLRQEESSPVSDKSLEDNEIKIGTKFKPARWWIEEAASDFLINPRTLTKRLKVLGILPGEDSRFSTTDICNAVFGDYEKERTRKMKAEADRVEHENAVRRGELMEIPDFLRRYEPICSAIRQRIMASGMADGEKDSILQELTKLHQP